MSTARISVNVDSEVKKNAQKNIKRDWNGFNHSSRPVT